MTRISDCGCREAAKPRRASDTASTATQPASEISPRMPSAMRSNRLAGQATDQTEAGGLDPSATPAVGTTRSAVGRTVASSWAGVMGNFLISFLALPAIVHGVGVRDYGAW